MWWDGLVGRGGWWWVAHEVVMIAGVGSGPGASAAGQAGWLEWERVLHTLGACGRINIEAFQVQIAFDTGELARYSINQDVIGAFRVHKLSNKRNTGRG